MLLFLLPTTERLFDLLIAITIIVWGIYKKELQDYARSLFSNLHQRFFLRSIAYRITDEEVVQIKRAELGPLKSWLLVLAKEYLPDRVTVTKFVKTDGAYLATCLAEVIDLEMTSIEDQVQKKAMPDDMMEELKRFHHLDGRWFYVSDARLVEVATFRDALISSGVRTAFYQSLPNSKGEFWAILAMSWRKERLFTPEDLRDLHYSALACAYILQSSEAWKQTKKP